MVAALTKVLPTWNIKLPELVEFTGFCDGHDKQQVFYLEQRSLVRSRILQ